MTTPVVQPQTSFAGAVRQQAINWGQKLGGAVLDQGFFAGSNFVLNVLLARWMPLEAYGTFVVIYAWFLLPQNIYEAAMIEPMNIFGAGKYDSMFKKYLAYLFFGHVGFSILISLIILLFVPLVLRFDSVMMGHTLFAMALVTPLMLLRWLTRQPFYVLSVPHLAALGGLLYFGFTVAIVVALHSLNQLTSVSALVAIAVGSALSSLILTTVYIKPDFKNKHTAENLSVRSVFQDHLSYGKWSSAARVLLWIYTNLHYILIPLMGSLTLSATLRATINLIMPLWMAISSTRPIIMPFFVRVYRRDAKAGLTKRMAIFLGLYLSVTVSYGLILVLFGKPIIHFLYKGQFDGLVTGSYLLVMAIIPVLSSISTVVDVALRAAGNVKQAFFVKIIPSILTVTLGLLLIASLGIIGAALSTAFIEIVTLILLIGAYVRRVAPQAPIDKAKNS